MKVSAKQINRDYFSLAGDKLTESQLAKLALISAFEGDIDWNESKDFGFNDRGSYINLIYDLITSLASFIFGQGDKLKNYFSFSYVIRESVFVFLYDGEFVYLADSDAQVNKEEAPFITGTMQYDLESLSSGCPRSIEAYIEEQKKDPFLFFKYSFEDLLPKVLKAYEDNIGDIPEDCFLHKTKIIQEMKDNYKKLCGYAETQGWR